MTVKDRSSGNPISNAFVKMAIQPHSPSSGVNTISTALAAATTSTQGAVEDKTTQSIYRITVDVQRLRFD